MEIQYITSETGSKVGVLLDLNTYQQLTARAQDAELLVNVSDAELQALADIQLSIDAQAQLSNLLAKNQEDQLSDVEQEQLGQLLLRVDNLNILKARARYTLKRLNTSAL